jgi:hypothetical protein
VIDVKAVNKFGRTTEVKKTINVKAAYWPFGHFKLMYITWLILLKQPYFW